MPLVMFSLAIAISRPPSTGVGSASLTKPQSNAGIDEPGQRVAAVQREPPEAEVAEHLQDAEQHQRAPQAEPDHERAADQRAGDRQPQADHLVDDADLGRAVVHRLEQERRQQRAGERVAELVEDDEGEERQRAGLREVARQAAEEGLEARLPRRPGDQRQRHGDAGEERDQVGPALGQRRGDAAARRAAARPARAPTARRRSA